MKLKTFSPLKKQIKPSETLLSLLQNKEETFANSFKFFKPDVYRKIQKNTFKDYQCLLVIGMGGSSLGAKAILDFYGHLNKKVYFLDNLDNGLWHKTFDELKGKKTLYMPMSKSGNTLEVLAATSWILENGANPNDFFAVVSEGKGRLFEICQELQWPYLTIPEKIGGRFSVFSPVGLLPLSFCGLALEPIFECLEEESQKVNDLNSDFYNFANFNFELMKNGKSALVWFCYQDKLLTLGDWFAQLWAESLGKDKKGQTPIIARGASDQHSLLQLFAQGPNDKHFHFLAFEENNSKPFLIKGSPKNRIENITVAQLQNFQLQGTLESLKEKKQPISLIKMHSNDMKDLAKLMVFYMYSTVVSADLMGINPFDQPGVERGKTITWELVNAKDK